MQAGDSGRIKRLRKRGRFFRCMPRALVGCSRCSRCSGCSGRFGRFGRADCQSVASHVAGRADRWSAAFPGRRTICFIKGLHGNENSLTIPLLLRGGAVWQLVGLITRRSQVQILPPLPQKICSADAVDEEAIPEAGSLFSLWGLVCFFEAKGKRQKQPLKPEPESEPDQIRCAGIWEGAGMGGLAGHAASTSL